MSKFESLRTVLSFKCLLKTQTMRPAVPLSLSVTVSAVVTGIDTPDSSRTLHNGMTPPVHPSSIDQPDQPDQAHTAHPLFQALVTGTPGVVADLVSEGFTLADLPVAKALEACIAAVAAHCAVPDLITAFRTLPPLTVEQFMTLFIALWAAQYTDERLWRVVRATNPAAYQTCLAGTLTRVAWLMQV